MGARALLVLLLGYSIYVGMGSVPPLLEAARSAVLEPRVFLSRLETPHAGEELLPVDSLEGARLLARTGSGNFWVTPEWNPHTFGYQQIQAELWPRKVDHAARFGLIFRNEKAPKGCAVVESGKELSLLDCGH